MNFLIKILDAMKSRLTEIIIRIFNFQRAQILEFAYIKRKILCLKLSRKLVI